MDLFIGRAVVGLLEDLVGADACILDNSETIDVERGGVDVDPPDLARAAFHRIDGFYRFSDKLCIVFRMLAINKDKTFLAAIFERFHLIYKIFMVEGHAFDGGIRSLETTVGAVVGAEVSDIERGKEDNSLAIDPLFQRFGSLFDLVDQFGVGGVDQNGSLFKCQTVFVQRLLNHSSYPFLV